MHLTVTYVSINAMRRSLAEPRKIYEERVRGRAVLYLDTNAWSDLSEAKTTDAEVARDLIKTAHAGARIVCPVSFSTITELLKRDVNPDSLAQAALMDLLSDGISYRATRHVRDLEILAACEFLLSGRADSPLPQVFTVIACYEADQRIVFPDGWSESGADEFMMKMEEFGLPSVRWLQQNRRSREYLDLHATTDTKYEREISRKRDDASTWAADANGKLDAQKLRYEEHICVLNKYILENVLRLVDPATFGRLALRLGMLNTDDALLSKVVRAMPSTWLSCEMHVQRMLGRGRRTRKQDFYDHEHAVLAIPYADAFVTSDGGILDVLRKVRVSGQFSCRLIRGMNGLREYLAERAAA